MKDLHFLKPLPVKHKIRLGPNRDSGYVVYGRILKETDVLLTYGVGWEVSFEEDFNNVTSSKVLMFDPTMFGKYLIDARALGRLLITFRIKNSIYYLRRAWIAWRKMNQLKKRHIYFINEGVDTEPSARYDTMQHHLDRFHLYDKQVLLKMDIEGKEYSIWEQDISYKLLTNVNQILIEFHDIKNLFRRFKKIIEKLRVNYELVHIHGNNWGQAFYLYGILDAEGNDIALPDTLELTFVRKDRISPEDVLETASYPVSGLDYPNNPYLPDHSMDFVNRL
ncbi:FkbM family methyltransferase [Chitinophaga japonensis]|uniref:Methyltransferase FkbM-like protein n=1 Tax=Chitinophaga japonensis TaxID=104662 RepID=A0A562SM15_CHIJA|nr:FkbM family methyltransferase [Chitinophaga japonensis]TWI82391.1 methyltransferase FkbM-like protein [Chitinophaga japonensis]